ncbi:MAG: DUF2330 domain-containing protein [Planctomycetota bacterium]|jgi:hypothetical protein
MGKKDFSSGSLIIRFFGISISCFLIPLASNLYADGKYFPEKVYKAPPAIPSQRAILVYKDGVEKLVIEAALEGEGKEFGWVIPLPAKPTGFEKASPGFLKTLSFVIGPKITNELAESLEIVLAITLVMTLWFLWVLTKKPKRPLYVLLPILLLVLFFVIFTFTLSTAGIGFGDMPGVKVEAIQEVGSYEIAVLETENAQALDYWLASNGFAGLTEKDKGIVSDYIRDGWRFVAARLRRDGDGFSRPHPLAMSFPADTPIYPVRLTATASSDVYLELFVIADRQAVNKKLVLELADRYSFKTRAKHAFPGKGFLPGFVGETHYQDIGHPCARDYMWDGCVLSKLCGTLKPADMTSDIVLKLQERAPYRKHYYSPQAAGHAGVLWGAVTWCILLLVIVNGYYKQLKQEGAKKFGLIQAMVAAFLGTLIVGAAAYLGLPKVEVRKMSGRGGSLYEFVRRQVDLCEKDAIAREYSYFDGMSRDAVAAEVQTYFNCRASRNLYTGRKLEYEDSPGNYTVLEDERGITLRTYSEAGFPSDFVLTVKPDEKASDYESIDELFAELVRGEPAGSKRSRLQMLVHTTPGYREYHAILVKLFRQRPAQVVPAILGDLTERLDNMQADSAQRRAVEYEAAMLGCITQTEPPLDVTDTATMDEFLRKISRRGAQEPALGL